MLLVDYLDYDIKLLLEKYVVAAYYKRKELLNRSFHINLYEQRLDKNKTHHYILSSVFDNIVKDREIKKITDSWYTTVNDCKIIYEKNLFFIRIREGLSRVSFCI